MIIKGISIILHKKTIIGRDDFNREIVSTEPVQIDNVVIGRPTSDDVLSEFNLSGKTIEYILALPKDDTNDWTDVEVEFYDERWRTVGIPDQYMPGFMGNNFAWNKRVKVERYE